MKKDNLKRVIVDFNKLTPEILKLLVEKYPDGYENVNIIEFKNINNEWVKAVEVNTDDTKYLVKVSTKLVQSMEDFDEDDYDEEDFDDGDNEEIEESNNEL